MQKRIQASKRSIEMNYAIREISVPADELAKAGQKMIRLNIGDPNKWDFETPEYFKAALREAVDRVDNGYGDSQGSLEFREAIVQREYEKHGVRITSDKVFVTSGVGEGISLLMGAFLEPGDEVLIPGPGYPAYAQYIKFFDGKVVPYRLIEKENWEPDIDMLRARISDRTKAIVVINPNNPTGAIFSEKSLRQIGDIAAEFQIPIISDEIYDKITFGLPYYSMSRLPSDVPRIILNGFSKVNLMPGWRMGYGYFMDETGLLDDIFEGLMKQCRARICPNVPCQWAAKASLQGPQDYIVDMNRRLGERAEFSYKRLNEIPGITTNRTEGAFYMFPKVELTDWKTDKEFVLDLMKSEGVVLVNGSGFCEEFGAGHFRTITLPKVEILAEAYDKLEHFMLKHQ
ncbi:MAG: aminotransferase class I/II-fold pyridoxal phosphate-dependent enzyme [Candidatus Methanomethylophilaceae archaeon]